MIWLDRVACSLGTEIAEPTRRGPLDHAAIDVLVDLEADRIVEIRISRSGVTLPYAWVRAAMSDAWAELERECVRLAEEKYAEGES